MSKGGKEGGGKEGGGKEGRRKRSGRKGRRVRPEGDVLINAVEHS